MVRRTGIFVTRSDDTFYDSLSAADVIDVDVTVQDDDGTGVLVQPLNVTFGAGNSGFYTVVLTSQPATDVTVTAYANSVCEMFPGTRTFTPQNWNQPQEFAVGSTLAGECLITHAVTSAGAYNASAESVFATIKLEAIQERIFQTRQQARQILFDYIEVFYNRQRLHSGIGYHCPCELAA